MMMMNIIPIPISIIDHDEVGVVGVQRWTGPLSDLNVGVVPQNHHILFITIFFDDTGDFDDCNDGNALHVGLLPHPAELSLFSVDQRRCSVAVPDNQ